jgi:hypothetical protein
MTNRPKLAGRPRGPLAGRPASLALAAVCALGLALAVAQGQARGPGRPGPPAPPSAGDAACQSATVREPCHSVTVGGRTWRYALLRASAPTARTALVDIGGPGEAVLSGRNGLGSLQAAHPSLARRYNLLFVEEPWVTRTPPAGCWDALGAFYRSVRRAHGSAAARGAAVARRCSVGAEPRRWGFDPRSFGSVVAAVERREGIAVGGFVGLSFASVRWSYLAARSLDWSVLLRPFPLRATGRELVAARAEATAALADAVATGRPASGAAAPTSGGSARSLPVTGFDRLSALVGLAYLDRAELARLGPGVVSGRDRATIGALSDRLWLRYGDDQISPAYLAYLDEVCGATGSWPAPPSRVGTVGGVLGAAHLPCRAVAGRPLPRPATGRLCLVTSPTDAVTPEAPARRSFPTSVAWVRSTDRSHSSFDGLPACLERVGALSPVPSGR